MWCWHIFFLTYFFVPILIGFVWVTVVQDENFGKGHSGCKLGMAWIELFFLRRKRQPTVLVVSSDVARQNDVSPSPPWRCQHDSPSWAHPGNEDNYCVECCWWTSKNQNSWSVILSIGKPSPHSTWWYVPFFLVNVLKMGKETNWLLESSPIISILNWTQKSLLNVIQIPMKILLNLWVMRF